MRDLTFVPPTPATAPENSYRGYYSLVCQGRYVCQKSTLVIFRGRVWGGGKCPAHVKYKRCCDFISARRYGSSAVRRMVAMHSTHEDRQQRNFCLSDMAHSTIHLEWHSLSASFPNFSCKFLLKTTSFFYSMV